ncbi:hypothetical protein ACFQPF_16670 [Fictibacillus iocasae]|uniref:SMODS and SLOG-associating 2TM effector domain-containing protein n=1 Tax=Fictibacillus iocasae TaxID=2715437 RepID=A0ABW2NVB3_9BACL
MVVLMKNITGVDFLDRLTELLEITLKLLSVKALDVLYPIYKLGEHLSGYFAFRFAAAILVFFLLLRIAERAVEFYSLHNFVHKKMLVPSSNTAEYKLFLSHVWDLETSKGIIDNAKAAKSRLLRFNQEELNDVLLYLKARRRTLSSSFLSTISAAFLSGVLLTYATEWAHNGSLNAEFFLKTALYTAVWYLIFEYRQKNKQHQVIAMIYSVNETLKSIQESRPHSVSYDDIQGANTYSSRSSQLFET